MAVQVKAAASVVGKYNTLWAWPVLVWTSMWNPRW